MFYRSTASYELVTWPKDTFHRRGDVSAECRRTSWIFMGQTGKVYFWWKEQYLLNLLAIFGELWGIECVCVCVCVCVRERGREVWFCWEARSLPQKQGRVINERTESGETHQGKSSSQRWWGQVWFGLVLLFFISATSPFLTFAHCIILCYFLEYSTKSCL